MERFMAASHGSQELAAREDCPADADPEDGPPADAAPEDGLPAGAVPEEVTCFVCNKQVPKNKAQKQGRSTGSQKFKCNPCNAVAAKINMVSKKSSSLKAMYCTVT